MMLSLRTIRGAAVGTVGTAAMAGAILFGGTPAANAAPAPAPSTSFAEFGPHGPADIPSWGGHGFGGGHGGGWGHGGFGRGGGGWGHGGWGHGGWGRGGGWGNGWGHGGGWGWGHRGWNPWW
jgi:hypothetical protein